MLVAFKLDENAADRVFALRWRQFRAILFGVDIKPRRHRVAKQVGVCASGNIGFCSIAAVIRPGIGYHANAAQFPVLAEESRYNQRKAAFDCSCVEIDALFIAVCAGGIFQLVVIFKIDLPQTISVNRTAHEIGKAGQRLPGWTAIGAAGVASIFADIGQRRQRGAGGQVPNRLSRRLLRGRSANGEAPKQRSAEKSQHCLPIWSNREDGIIPDVEFNLEFKVLKWTARFVVLSLTAIFSGAAHADEADAADVAAGMKLFRAKANCQTCHGWAGDGRKIDSQMPDGANLRESVLDRKTVATTIQCGRPGTGMPAFDRLAYSDGRCYGMKLGNLDKSGLGLTDPPATLAPREINLIVEFLFARVMGKGPMTRDGCIEYWGSDVEICKEIAP